MNDIHSINRRELVLVVICATADAEILPRKFTYYCHEIYEMLKIALIYFNNLSDHISKGTLSIITRFNNAVDGSSQRSKCLLICPPSPTCSWRAVLPLKCLGPCLKSTLNLSVCTPLSRESPTLDN